MSEKSTRIGIEEEFNRRLLHSKEIRDDNNNPKEDAGLREGQAGSIGINREGHASKENSYDTRKRIIHHAGFYANLGWAIHPCCPVTHGRSNLQLEAGSSNNASKLQRRGSSRNCSKPGKVPYEPETGKHASGWTTPQDYHADTWNRWLESGTFNIGMLSGVKSGIIGVDLDGSENIRYFEKLVSCRVDEIPTWTFATGNGYRLLYGIGRNRNSFPSFNIEEDGCRIEILGDGKQTVLPPSLHVSGRTYKWAELRSPFVLDEPLGVPEWILDCIKSTTIITSDAPDPIDWSEIVARGIDSGGRNEGLTRVIGRVLSPAPLDIDTLYQVARCLNEGMCRPPLPELELRTIVKSLFKRESIQRAAGHDEQEIRIMMSNYSVNRSNAIIMLDSM